VESRGKKAVVVAISLTVIVVMVAWIAKRQFGGPATPEWFEKEMAEEKIEMIDEQTFETMTKTRREWEELGRKEGKYKNPNTGEYTMLPAAVCPACLEKIPKPVPPYGQRPTKEQVIAFDQVLKEYACPKCGARGIFAPGAARGMVPTRARPTAPPAR